MRAMQLEKPAAIEQHPLKLAYISPPQPGQGQVRVKVYACGVCRTDLHTVEGDLHLAHMPLIPGHQVVGVVDEVGEGVENLTVGDWVGIPWLHSACGECVYCRSGNENLCPRARFTGLHVDGGYGEYMLAEARFALLLPDGLRAEHAAPLLCAGIIGYRSLRLSEVKPGERLALVGFGASAHLTIQVARQWDVEVFVFTRAEEHRRHARQLGAAWVGGIEETPPAPVDRAIIFAPAGALVPATLEKIRPGGTLAINAVHMSDIPSMPYRLLYGERTLRSVANATYQDGVDFLQLAAETGIRADIVRYPLEQANQALLDLKQSRLVGEAVLMM